MKQESFLASMPKLILAVSLIVGIGTVLGMLVYSETMPKNEVVVNDEVEKIENQEQEIINAQQVILSDEEVYEILKEFANEGLTLFPERMEKYNKALIDALEFKGETTKEKLTKIEKNLEEEGKVIQDAPDMRSFYSAYIKVCLAKSIIYDDLKNTCGINKNSSLNLDSVDDLTALEQILPYFVIGLAYYSEGDYVKANHYFNQIELHRQALKTYNYELDLPYLKLYKRAYNKAISLIQDETADWKTYRNEEYGFEVKYPSILIGKDFYRAGIYNEAWTLIESYDKNIIFGTQSSKAGGGVWGIFIKDDLKSCGGRGTQFADRKEDIKEIKIGELNAKLITVTTNSNPDWISEIICIAKNNRVFEIGNGAVKIPEFKIFYNSFKFIEEDETADWQTYQNEEYGFELKYKPKFWTLKKTEVEVGYVPANLHSENDNCRIVLGVGGHGLPFDWTKATEEIFINGKNTQKQIWKDGNNDIGLIEVLFQGGYGIELYLHPDNQQDCMDEFNQILSTFKFIEESDNNKTLTLNQLMNKNLDFKNFMDEVLKVNSELDINKFSVSEPQNIKEASYSYDASNYLENKSDPRWIFSPNGERAVSIYGQYGEPDSSLDLYNRKDDKKIENLEFCGTPCSYWAVYWLNNEQFVFIENTEAYFEEEIKYTINVHFYDIKNNIRIDYRSQAIDESSIMPNILEWRERLFNVCRKVSGNEERCSYIIEK